MNDKQNLSILKMQYEEGLEEEANRELLLRYPEIDFVFHRVFELRDAVEQLEQERAELERALEE